MPNGIITVRMGNYSLIRLLGEATGLELGGVAAVFLSAIAAAALWRGSRGRAADGRSGAGEEEDRREDLLIVGIGCVIPLVTGRLVWMHYLLLAIPLVIVLLGPRAGGWRPAPLTRPLAALGLLLIADYPFTFPLPDSPARVLLSGAGLLLLYALGVRELLLPPPPSPVPSPNP
jgi:hypothetical protein